MQKIGHSTSTANSVGEFTEGNAGGVPPTLLKAAWLNAVQRELINLIEGAGIELNAEDFAQALKAVQGLVAGGNAATATKLQTARTIGGVAFDGSANINLPGVNAPGNQNTTGHAATAGSAGACTGNAATATKLQTARTIGGVAFDGSASINLPGVNTPGNQSTTGNAATATKLQTARTIGGVAFDGSANINLPGVNAPGNQSTSGNAATATKLAAARTLTIGGTTKSFDGTSNLTWTLADIGSYPVGSQYVQFAELDGAFSAAKSPSTLFGGTWTLKFNTESVFFRTEGTLAAAGRSSGVQGDAIRNITGAFGPNATNNGHATQTATGAFEVGAGTNGRGADGGTSRVYSFDASRVVPTASENRVTNRLIRVWERVA